VLLAKTVSVYTCFANNKTKIFFFKEATVNLVRGKKFITATRYSSFLPVISAKVLPDPRRDCGEVTFANQLTIKRVWTPLTSREAASGESPC
jgi:hypothetical protein